MKCRSTNESGWNLKKNNSIEIGWFSLSAVYEIQTNLDCCWNVCDLIFHVAPCVPVQCTIYMHGKNRKNETKRKHTYFRFEFIFYVSFDSTYLNWKLCDKNKCISMTISKPIQWFRDKTFEILKMDLQTLDKSNLQQSKKNKLIKKIEKKSSIRFQLLVHFNRLNSRKKNSKWRRTISNTQRGVCVHKCVCLCMFGCMHVVCRNAIRIFLLAPKHNSHNRTKHIRIQRHHSFQQFAYIRMNAQMCVTSAFHAVRNSHSFIVPTVNIRFHFGFPHPAIS